MTLGSQLDRGQTLGSIIQFFVNYVNEIIGKGDLA